jgi:hypothetical protein
VEELAMERRVRWFEQVRQAGTCSSGQRTKAEFSEVEFGFGLLVASAQLERSVHCRTSGSSNQKVR